MRVEVRRLTRERLIGKVGLPPKAKAWVMDSLKPKTSYFEYTTGEITR